MADDTFLSSSADTPSVDTPFLARLPNEYSTSATFRNLVDSYYLRNKKNNVFRLLDLPPEIRLIIAEYALTLDKGMTFHEKYYKVQREIVRHKGRVEDPYMNHFYCAPGGSRKFTRMDNVWTRRSSNMSPIGSEDPIKFSNNLSQVCRLLRKETQYLEFKVNTLHFRAHAAYHKLFFTRSFSHAALTSFRNVNIYGVAYSRTYTSWRDEFWRLNRIGEACPACQFRLVYAMPVLLLEDPVEALKPFIILCNSMEAVDAEFRASTSVRNTRIEPFWYIVHPVPSDVWKLKALQKKLTAHEWAHVSSKMRHSDKFPI